MLCSARPHKDYICKLWSHHKYWTSERLSPWALKPPRLLDLMKTIFVCSEATNIVGLQGDDLGDDLHELPRLSLFSQGLVDLKKLPPRRTNPPKKFVVTFSSRLGFGKHFWCWKVCLTEFLVVLFSKVEEFFILHQKSFNWCCLEPWALTLYPIMVLPCEWDFFSL